MYVDNIVSFGKFLRRFPRKNKNNQLRDYCDKVVYEMIMCILILKRKNQSRIWCDGRVFDHAQKLVRSLKNDNILMFVMIIIFHVNLSFS